jgi:hypothetical protein
MGKIYEEGRRELSDVGSAIQQGFHDVTDTVGLTDYEGQARAEKAAQEATDRANRIEDDEIAFQREQYNDWKDIYGTLQEQEADYLAKYTGEDIVAQQLGQASSEFQTAEQDLSRSLAQRGLSSSGAMAAGLTQLASQEAMTKANIRSSQDSIAEQKRLNFLGLGLGQGTTMLGTQANVASAGVSSSTDIANQQTSSATTLGTANIASMGNLVSAGGKALGGAMEAGLLGDAAAGSDSRLKDNLKLLKTVDGYNIYSWDWNKVAEDLFGYTGNATGVIAQEVRDINKSAVDKYRGYLVIDKSKLPKGVQGEINYGK